MPAQYLKQTATKSFPSVQHQFREERRAVTEVAPLPRWALHWRDRAELGRSPGTTVQFLIEINADRRASAILLLSGRRRMPCCEL